MTHFICDRTEWRPKHHMALMKLISNCNYHQSGDNFFLKQTLKSHIPKSRGRCRQNLSWFQICLSYKFNWKRKKFEIKPRFVSHFPAMVLIFYIRTNSARHHILHVCLFMTDSACVWCYNFFIWIKMLSLSSIIDRSILGAHNSIKCFNFIGELEKGQSNKVVDRPIFICSKNNNRLLSSLRINTLNSVVSQSIFSR